MVCKRTWVQVRVRPYVFSSPVTHEPHSRSVTVSPCLTTFILNLLRTDETVPLLLTAQAWTHTEPPNVTGEEKAHGPTWTRTQDLLHTMRTFWPLSYRAAQSTCDTITMGTVLLWKKARYIVLCHVDRSSQPCQLIFLFCPMTRAVLYVFFAQMNHFT